MAPVGGQRSAFEDGAAGPDQAGDRRDALSQGGRAVRPREFRVSRSRRASCNEVPQVEQKGAAWRTQPGRERRCSNAGAHLGRDTPRGQPWSPPPDAR